MDSYGNIHTPDKLVELRRNTYLPAALAEALCAALPDSVQIPDPGSGAFKINPDHVPALAGLLQEIVAYTIASLVNAGSERDAVMENVALTVALEAELRYWVES